MEPKYDHTQVEGKIYEMWENGGFFKPEINPKGKPFTIVLPPPNSNGELHLGHCMFVLEDILTRFHRMQGDATLWLPGTDHAGILTQAVFEKKLQKELGKNRYDLGRQEFYKQVYKFCLDSKSTIENQLRSMGFSLDWSRNKFTLDPEISKIVLETFVKLYSEDLIYRGSRMVNWCPQCRTTLSDLETEDKERTDKLYFLDYGPIQIATTRPETIFADVAIAVNPKDKKYKKLIGQKAIVPLIGREIPIIADEAVEVGFGTDALKVTPGHDPVDFEIGERHNLDIISVIDFDGKIKFDPKHFSDLDLSIKQLEGMRVPSAREKTAELLTASGKLLKTEDLTHSVKVCERTKNVIEPLISRQWFVKIKPLAKPAIDAVKNKKIKFTPTRWYNQYLTWMENLKDWPVSRQIWWGHRMPVYYCVDCQNEAGKKAAEQIKNDSPIADTSQLEKPIVSVEKPLSCPVCQGQDIIQDPDTFDTWFSSGQWPYTTLMTANKGDFEKFYPTNVMGTAWDIFFVWVARMIMLGLYTKSEIPFTDVLAYGLVRDQSGQKMSKSKGNGVDPTEMIQKYSADATRMGLVSSRDVTTDWSISPRQLEEKITGYRNFGNKIWNIGRFILISMENKQVPWFEKNMAGLTQDDQEIISKLNALIKTTTKNINAFKLGIAADDIYQFIWHEFADKYIESSKDRIKNGDTTVLSVLRHIYLNSLKLLHPFMPFITEEIWSIMPRKDSTPLIISSWPSSK